MIDVLAVRGQMQPQDKMWLALAIFGVAFAIVILAWIAHKLHALFREDEGSDGSVHEFLGQLRDSQSEGDVTPEEFRSIQRRLVEQSMRSGDSSPQTRVTPAKSAEPEQPKSHVPCHDDTEDHSP